MRKRKPPIIPVTILCICAAVAFGYNYQAGINPDAAAKAQSSAPQAQDVTVKPRATQGVSSTINSVKAALTKDQPATAPAEEGIPIAGAPGEPKRSPMMNKGAPTIEVSKAGAQKPVPNDSSISSQWYQPTSSKSGQ